MADLFRVTTVHSGLPGSPYLSTFHFNDEGISDPQDLISAVNQFWIGCGSSMSNGLTSQTQGVIQRFVDTTGDLFGEFSGVPTSTVGTDTSLEEWTAKQGVLNLRTGSFSGGTRIRGRLYIPGVCISGGEQTPDLGYQADIQTAGDLLRTSAATLGASWVVWRRPRPPEPDPPGFRIGTFGDVISATVSDQWGVLRSRRT